MMHLMEMIVNTDVRYFYADSIAMIRVIDKNSRV